MCGLNASVTVTLAGSILFLAFGLIYLYESFAAIDTDIADFNPTN